ncbi:hypothetical protein N8I74_19245 [Chitiniphilus purpureus]|uniref:Tetratricopeptide repeat protein n=1 Tax=Chitiniphilus purpureus TaxID=2981137 RepID=A0ABY6DM35_9NEIS|nr:hypothetical protein [Chitiniphilus sp. CD1]UXY15419.1 hypothetical protein N8I74_19245 [Chitiniphilus sp. CD1]
MNDDLAHLLLQASQLVRCQSTEAMALAQQARALAQQRGDMHALVRSLTLYAHGLFMLGKSGEAQRTLLEAIELGELEPVAAAQGETLQLAARVAYTLGEYERAGDHWYACIALAADRITPSQRILAHIGLGQLCYAQEQYALALAHHRKAAKLAEECDDPHLDSTSMINVAADLIQLTRYDEATAALKQTLPQVRAEQNYQFEAEIFSLFGEIRLRLGDHEAARMSLMVALKINRLHINTWGEASVLLRLARCSLAVDELEIALEQLARAHTLADGMGSLPLLAQIHASLAEVAERTADAEAIAYHHARHQQLRQQLLAQSCSGRFATLELRLSD